MDFFDSKNVLTEAFNLSALVGNEPIPIRAKHTFDAGHSNGDPQIIQVNSVRDLSIAVKMQEGGYITCAFSPELYESLVNPPDEYARLTIKCTDSDMNVTPIAIVELNVSSGVLQAMGPEFFKITAFQEKADGTVLAYPIKLQEEGDQLLSISNIPSVNAPQNVTALTPKPTIYSP